jgi:putative spermidine/putrescine transport system substrate-binding protein/spermidine/putrescine transport system substrate-binding protein
LALEGTAELKTKLSGGRNDSQENTTGWIDHLMITTASENKELIGSWTHGAGKNPELVAGRDTHTHANPQAGQLMTADERRSAASG